MNTVKLAIAFLIGVLVGAILPAVCFLAVCFLALPAKTPENILKELNAAGLEYEGKWLGPKKDEFHLKRTGDQRTWEELAAFTPLSRSPRPVAITILPPHHYQVPDESHRYIGDFVIIGDPAELDRIVELLSR